MVFKTRLLPVFAEVKIYPEDTIGIELRASLRLGDFVVHGYLRSNFFLHETVDISDDASL